MPFAGLAVDDRQLGQTRLHQPTATQTRRFAARRHLHFKIDLVPLLHAGGQIAAHQHHRSVRRGEQFVRILHADRLQLVEQRGALRRRGRIGARVIEPRYQRHRFDLHVRVAKGACDFADQLGLRFQDLAATLGTL